MQVHEKDTGFGQVFTEQELAARRAGSPDDNLLSARGLRLRDLANQRGQHVGVLQIEVVARAIEVRRHRR
jgi:hypothetical protein